MSTTHKAIAWEIPGHWFWKGRVVDGATGKTVAACKHRHRAEAPAKACADRMLQQHKRAKVTALEVTS